LAGGEKDTQRLALPAEPGLDEVLGGQGLLRGPDGVEHVGLASAPVGGPLGPADLDDVVAGLVEEGGESGAVAADAFQGPAATARDVLTGEVQQALVTRALAGESVLARTAPIGLTAAAARVSRWVSTPMTPSICSARMATRLFSLVGGRLRSASAWMESPRGGTVMSHAARRTSC
jgi:hypothetical protein